MDIFELLEREWQSIISLLPVDLDKSAFAYGALLRKRQVKSGEDLLRILLAYCWGRFSQRTTAAWAEQAQIAKMADTSLRERIRNSDHWVGYLLTSYLKERTSLCLDGAKPLRIRLIDATCVSRPACTQPDWRVHVGFNLEHMRCDHLELTEAKHGESFQRFQTQKGDLLIGDRQYGRRADVYSAVRCGADVIVRLAVNGMPLLHQDGREFKLIDEAGNLEEEEVLDLPVLTVEDRKNGIPAVAGRLIVRRKGRTDEEKARAKLIKERKKTDKKPTPGALGACGFIFLFTTLGQEVPATDILELYRFRWQIEIAFKRMKSLIRLDEMVVTDDRVCKTYILGKLLAVLLVEDLIDRMRPFSPCGGEQPKTDASLAYI